MNLMHDRKEVFEDKMVDKVWILRGIWTVLVNKLISSIILFSNYG